MAKDVKAIKREVNADIVISLYKPIINISMIDQLKKEFPSKHDRKNKIIKISYQNNIKVYYKIIKFIDSKLPGFDYQIKDDNYCSQAAMNAAKIMLSSACVSGHVQIITTDMYNNNMKFACIIMNPPWGDFSSVGLGESILKQAMNHSDNIVALLPDTSFVKCNENTKKAITRKQMYTHCDNVIIYGTNDFPGISARTNFIIAHFNMNKTFENNIHIIDNSNRNLNLVTKLSDDRLSWRHVDLTNFLKTINPIVNNLIDKYGVMMPKNGISKINQWEYFENKSKHSHKIENAKEYLNKNKYKYLITRTTYEHFTDPIYESFCSSAPCTWLMNKKNIQQNMKYWLSEECKFIFLLRKCLIIDVANSFAYHVIPAIDFDMPEDKFKIMVNNLYKFTDKEYKYLYDCAKKSIVIK